MHYTWFSSAFDNGDIIFCGLTIFIMGGELIFAAGSSYIFETLDFSFGILGWIIMRAGLIVLWLRVATNIPELRRTALQTVFGLFFAQLLWVIIYFGTEAGSFSFYIMVLLTALFEIITPIAPRYGKEPIPWHRYHIIERHGLLNIIVLGEVLLSISVSIGKFYEGVLSWDLLVLSISGFIIVFCLWALYFLADEHLVSREHKTSFIWGYGHIAVFGSGAAIGAGISIMVDVITGHSNTSQYTASLHICIPISIYLLGLWFVRDQFHTLGTKAWALPVSGGAILLATLLGAPVWIFALLLPMAITWHSGLLEKMIRPS